MLNRKRIRDVVIEVLIAATVVTSLVVYRFSHPDAELSWGYVALAANTLIVFGYLVTWFRADWRKLSFWSWLLALLLAHLACYAFVLARIGQFPFVYYVVLNGGELLALVRFLRRMMASPSDGRPDT